MIIGVPREIKPDENRVGLLPVGAETLAADGHTVLIQRSAGAGSGFADKEYAAVAAIKLLYALCRPTSGLLNRASTPGPARSSVIP